MALKMRFLLMGILILSLSLSLILSLIGNSYAQESNSCDYIIEVLLNKTLFTKEEFAFRLRTSKIEGAATVFTGRANITDSSGGAVKEYIPWKNQTISVKRTSGVYSPNLEPGDYTINAEIKAECDDMDLFNNKISLGFEIISGSGTAATSTSTTTSSTTTSTTSTTTSSTTTSSTTTSSTTTSTTSTTTTSTTGTTTTTLASEKNIKEKNEREEEVVYKDDSELIKKIALALLIGLSVILNVVLIWKR